MSDQFEAVYKAWVYCRRRKRKSAKAQYNEVHLLDHLVDTANALQCGYWQPQPPVFFTVAYPKVRGVYSAAFVDRVVHHYLVSQLEAFFDPRFIHDVYSNRIGKGTHAAVDRLQHFMRSKKAEGVSFVQPDVRNFFNTIDRRILFKQLQNWHQNIACFLQEQLGPSLKTEFTLASVIHGAGCLGYITRPHYRLVGRRVVHHFRSKLNAFARERIDKYSNGFAIIRLNLAVRDQLLAVFSSYLGRFKHANYYRLLQDLFKPYSWLSWLFHVENGKVIRLWEAKFPTSFRSHVSFFRHVFPHAELRVQKGYKQHHWPANNCIKDAVTPSVYWLIIKEQGYLKSGLKRRYVEQKHFYQGEALCA